MRSIIVLGVAALVVAGGASEAEARFRLRLGGSSFTPRPTAMPVSRSGLVVIPGLGLGSSAARSNDYEFGRNSTGSILPVRSVLTAEAMPRNTEDAKPDDAASSAAPAPAPAPVAKAAQPWCRTGRVAGSGSGFCLMN